MIPLRKGAYQHSFWVWSQLYFCLARDSRELKITFLSFFVSRVILNTFLGYIWYQLILHITSKFVTAKWQNRESPFSMISFLCRVCEKVINSLELDPFSERIWLVYGIFRVTSLIGNSIDNRQIVFLCCHFNSYWSVSVINALFFHSIVHLRRIFLYHYYLYLYNITFLTAITFTDFSILSG